jgi:hypothetical protein
MHILALWNGNNLRLKKEIFEPPTLTCFPVNPWQMTRVFLSTHTLAVEDMHLATALLAIGDNTDSTRDDWTVNMFTIILELSFGLDLSSFVFYLQWIGR